MQNLRTQSLPAPENIFGLDKNGNPKVKFHDAEDGKPQQDIILEKCYRNSRPVLVTAHALGFGIYREPKNDRIPRLVQMFERESLWKDIGYEIAEGKLEDGNRVVLQRTSQSSPDFLEKHSSIDDLIVFQCFDTQEEQWRYIMSFYRQRYGPKIHDIHTLNNDVLRSWMYGGVFGKSQYEQGLLDFAKDCEEYDTLYIINGLTVKDANIEMEIKNAEKFCLTIIYQKILSNGPQREYRLKIDELSGYFFFNLKKNKVLYYEVDMGTQTWCFGI